jgi:hypothetical protein
MVGPASVARKELSGLRDSTELPILSEGFIDNLKDNIHALLQKLSEKASPEDIQYNHYVLEKVLRGLQRAESEGVVTHADAKARLGRWLALQSK